jgi:hypothetical protein
MILAIQRSSFDSTSNDVAAFGFAEEIPNVLQPVTTVGGEDHSGAGLPLEPVNHWLATAEALAALGQIRCVDDTPPP